MEVIFETVGTWAASAEVEVPPGVELRVFSVEEGD